jgi:hypothetical protein
VDSIRKCRPADIQNTLADLPQTLEATYQRILREIVKPQQEYAHRLFKFVAVSSRPLLVEELADLLAFETDGPPFQNFMRIGAGKIQYTKYCPRAPVCLSWSMVDHFLETTDGGSAFGNTFEKEFFS